MKTSFKILLFTVLAPLIYSGMLNAYLYQKYKLGEIISQPKIHRLNYERKDIPEIRHVVAEEVKRFSIIVDNQHFVEKKNNSQGRDIQFEIRSDTLFLRLDPNLKTVHRGLRTTIVHVPSNVTIQADHSSLNIAVHEPQSRLKVFGSNLNLHFLNTLPGVQTENRREKNDSSRIHLQHLQLSISNSSLEFPDNYVLDSMTGSAADSYLAFEDLDVKNYNLIIDSTSNIKLSGSMLTRLVSNEVSRITLDNTD